MVEADCVAPGLISIIPTPTGEDVGDPCNPTFWKFVKFLPYLVDIVLSPNNEFI